MKKQMCIGLVIFNLSLCAAGQSRFSVLQTQTGLEVIEAGKKVCGYQKISKPAPGARAHYLHPLYDLSGHILTDDFPSDHKHHHGLWWAWHQIRKNGKQIADGWTIDNIRWDVKALDYKTLPSGNLLITMDVDWLTDSRQLLVKVLIALNVI